MEKFVTDKNGQALLLVIIVLFIVFFLVVSVSENISVDTTTTQKNQDFQRAFASASTGLAAAKAYIAQNKPTSNYSSICDYTGGYKCDYVIIPQTKLTAVVQKDQTVQANIMGASTATVEFTDDTSVLFVNVTKTDDTNYMCIFYPSTLSLSPNAILNNFGVPAGCPAKSIAKLGNYYTIPLTLPNNGEFLRAGILNYSGNSSTIIISPSPSVVQQYQIVGTGYFNGSRRVLTSEISTFGNAPSIFDYVLFNGGPGSSISF